MNSSRILALLISAAVLGCGTAKSLTHAADTSGVKLTPDQKARLHKALQSSHSSYDQSARMLREPLHSPGYHTTLKDGWVHSTRSSLTYAVALLDTGEEPLRERAEQILQTVIALQDQDPSHKTCGIWPWFLEEPLPKMSPPDYNWADFCGVQLLQVARDHRARLSPALAAQVDKAIELAAQAIKRRNVGPGYTNIAIMGTYVTLVAGELYGWSDLRDYGLQRMRRFYEYTKELGAFSEYNSPTYSIVAISELGRILLHAKDAEARRMAEELYRMAWQDVAEHFHVPTRQWAGPHSRCYRTLLGVGTLAVIERSLKGLVSFGAEEPSIVDQRLPLPCPTEFGKFFTAPPAPHDVVKVYAKGDHPVVATTHLAPLFALGSINRGDLWNQRRSLIAYWGTVAKPSYLHLRFLRDGYDFADAQFFSAQRAGDVLAAINFGTDGGNTHIGLDRIKNGVVKAKDLRLRFEFGGEVGKEKLIAPGSLSEPAHVRSDKVDVCLAVPHAVFGNEKLRWETGGKDGVVWLDVVICSGAEREVSLKDMEQAALGIAVRIGAGEAAAPKVRASVRNGRLALGWDSLQVSAPIRPDKVGALQRAAGY